MVHGRRQAYLQDQLGFVTTKFASSLAATVLQMTAACNLSFACIFAVIADRNLACNCAYVCADAIMVSFL